MGRENISSGRVTDEKIISVGSISSNSVVIADEVIVDEIGSSSVVVADKVIVKNISSGSIVVADEVYGIRTVSSGALLISEDIVSDGNPSSNGKILSTIDNGISYLKDEIEEVDKRTNSNEDTSYPQYPEREKESFQKQIDTLKQIQSDSL